MSEEEGNELIEKSAAEVIPHGYSQDVLIQLRRKGLPKPKNVPWSTWNAPFKMNDRHHVVAYSLARGLKKTEISEMFEIDYQQVINISKSQKVQDRVKEIRYELFGEDAKKRFDALMPEGIKVLSEILNDAKCKDSTRLAAAKEVFDRSQGKPTQKFETSDTSLADLYREMSKISQAAIENSIHKRQNKDLGDIEDVHFQEVEKSDSLETKHKEEPASNVNKALESFYGKEKQNPEDQT